MTTESSKPRNSGSLTITLRKGDELRVITPTGEEVTYYVAALSATRVSVNVRAPRSWPIVRESISD